MQEINFKNKPAYRAASRNGSFGDWMPTSAGPNSVLEQDHALLRDRCRDSYRADGYVKKIIHTLATSEIGDGIHTHSIASNRTYRRQIQALWNEWIFQCDAHGNMTYDGIINQAIISRYLVGGQFLRMIPITSRQNLSVPLILQGIEVDQVPIEMTEKRGRGNIKQGIEFNAAGRKTAVHIFKEHPNDHIDLNANGQSQETIRIPLDDIIHHYEPIRPGQVREVPWIVEAIETAHRLKQYNDSELTRKHIKSMITGFITREQFTEEDMLFDPWTGEELVTGFQPGNIKLNPGMLGTLNPGEDIKLTDPDNQADGFDDYVRYHVQQMAAATYVPYELISGDYRGINDRLVRSVLDDYRRFINARQKLVTIPQLCQRIWHKFNDIAVMSGSINAPGYFENRSDFIAAEFIPQRTPYIHPVQDRQGIQLDFDMGLTTRQDELHKLRKNPEEVERQIQEERSNSPENSGDNNNETA